MEIELYKDLAWMHNYVELREVLLTLGEGNFSTTIMCLFKEGHSALRRDLDGFDGVRDIFSAEIGGFVTE